MPNTVVITGGSSGLGLGLAHRFVERGDRVALIARDAAKLERARGLLLAGRDGAQVLTISCDVSDAEATHRAFERIAADLGAPDDVICSAGVLDEGRFEDMTIERMRRAMDINYFGAVQTVQAALPHLRESGQQPRIALIASVAAVMGVYGYSAYCASKHALLGLAECLRIELRAQGIRVQVALPPEFESPMVDPSAIDRSAENIALAQTIPPLTLQQAVDGVWNGLQGKRFVFAVGATARAVTFSHRLFPGLSRLVVDRRIRAMR